MQRVQARIAAAQSEPERLVIAVAHGAGDDDALRAFAPRYFGSAEEPRELLRSTRPPWLSAELSHWFAEAATAAGAPQSPARAVRARRSRFGARPAVHAAASTQPAVQPHSFWWTPERRRLNFSGWVLPTNQTFSWPANRELPPRDAPVFVRDDGTLWTHPTGTMPPDGWPGDWIIPGGTIDGASLCHMAALLGLLDPASVIGPLPVRLAAAAGRSASRLARRSRCAKLLQSVAVTWAFARQGRGYDRCRRPHRAH